MLRGTASIASLLLLAACGDDATAPKTWTAETAHEAIKESNPNYNGKGEFRIEFG